jgi:putative FmdB family regulatory protein
MPIYVFECKRGHRTDAFYKVDDCPAVIGCPKCRAAFAKKIPVIGGVERQEPTWMNDQVREVLQDTDRVRKGLEAPIENRKQWKERMKERGVVEIGPRMF